MLNFATKAFCCLCLFIPSLASADILGYACADQACNVRIRSYDTSIVNQTKTLLPIGTQGWYAVKKGGRVCRDSEGFDCTGCNAGNWHTGYWPSGGEQQWHHFCSL